MTTNVEKAGTVTVLTNANAVPPELAELCQLIVVATELALPLEMFNVLTFKHFPLLAGLFKTVVVEVEVRFAPVVFPIIVVALIRFGAAILSPYKPNIKLYPKTLAELVEEPPPEVVKLMVVTSKLYPLAGASLNIIFAPDKLYESLSKITPL